MSQQAGSGFVGERIGEFVATSRWDALPHSVRHEGKRSLLNFFGCALGVAGTPPIEMALRVLTSLSGAKRVTVIGRSERLDLLGAAFINAVGANLLDYDDTHLPTVIHPTAPVAPPHWRLRNSVGCRGRRCCTPSSWAPKSSAGSATSVSPGHYARGWHITSTCGVFGSAVASAKLLGLDARQTWHALGIAASQSAGLVENLPSAAKNVGRRQCRPQWVVRSTAGGTGLHRGARRDRGRARLGTCDGRRPGYCRCDR